MLAYNKMKLKLTMQWDQGMYLETSHEKLEEILAEIWF